jgi:tetratricopeptide (TPR) repeat protein
MLDREEYDKKEKFKSDAEQAIELAEDALKRGHDSAWAYLTIGNAHAYIASLEAKDGSWWTAMRRGLKAKGAYLDALKVDPNLYDAYLGLGTYHYWKSAKTEFINWLPLVGDRKDDGVEELYLAVDSSLFSSDLALNSLVWIHLDRKKPAEALACAQRLHAKLPESRLVRWGLAFSNYSAGRFHEALDHFEAIITSLESDSTQNYFNLIECRYHRAQIYESVGDAEAATAEYEKILSYSPAENVLKKQRKHIDLARQKTKE